MSAPVPIWRGHISDEGRFGLLEVQKPARQAYFRTLAGLDVDIEVRPHKDRRSQQANAYYWSCVLEKAAKELSDGDQSAEDIHDAMCELFLPNERKRVAFFNRMTGAQEVVECADTRRSSKLAGDLFYTFVEKVRKKLLEYGVWTDDPDPQYWRKRASKKAA